MTEGDVFFELDHCVVSVYDPTTDKTVKYNVVPPYSDDELHNPSANPTSAKIKGLKMTHHCPTEEWAIVLSLSYFTQAKTTFGWILNGIGK